VLAEELRTEDLQAPLREQERVLVDWEQILEERLLGPHWELVLGLHWELVLGPHWELGLVLLVLGVHPRLH
jgi:hypothetical protein